MTPLAHLDALLRSRGPYAPESQTVPVRSVALFLVTCSFGYGAVMGSYGGRTLQSLYAGLKVPLLIGASTLLCLPSFFVLNTALGLREDFAAALRAVLVAQGTVGIALLSLSPLVGFLYASMPPSSGNYPWAILASGLMFFLAALGGQLVLARHYRRLIALQPRHRFTRAAWLGLYLFVAIQMAWTLRPFVGDPALATQFFRAGAWGNAYVELAGILWRLVS